MARPELRRPENAPGPVFVDASCIDCDTCRWMAPETFARRGHRVGRRAWKDEVTRLVDWMETRS